METLDRLKEAFVRLARAAHPNIDRFALYEAKLLKQHANLRRVDVDPTDPRLGPISNIPLMVGVPGLEVVLTPGHMLLLGWRNGWPDQPYAALWEAAPGGNTPVRLSFNASKVELGGSGLKALVEEVVLGQTPCQFTGSPHHITGLTSKKVLAKGS